jgi:hypothetical protein
MGILIRGAAKIAERLAARAVTGAVQLLHSAGRLIGQVVAWVHGLARGCPVTCAGSWRSGELLDRLCSLVDERVADGAMPSLEACS